MTEPDDPSNFGRGHTDRNHSGTETALPCCRISAVIHPGVAFEKVVVMTRKYMGGFLISENPRVIFQQRPTRGDCGAVLSADPRTKVADLMAQQQSGESARSSDDQLGVCPSARWNRRIALPIAIACTDNRTANGAHGLMRLSTGSGKHENHDRFEHRGDNHQ